VNETLLRALVERLRAEFDGDAVVSHLARNEVAQKVIADAPACVLVAADNGQLIAASHEALHLLGHTLASLRELNVTDVAAAEDEAASERLWESFLRHRSQTGGFALRHRNGGTIRTSYVAAANVVAGLSIALHEPKGWPTG
jgi:PAS domain S-box-containing protein